MNDQIKSDPIRLIDSEGNQVGVVSLAEALENAADADLDLVEISPNADPPVCRVMDYGKFLYNASKQKHEAKKKQKQITVKEVKFRPGTDVGDYEVKLRNLTRFLEAGNKTKVTMRFRGREMAHKELGLEMLKKVEQDLAEIASVEQAATMEGRQMVMVMGPKRT
ncbi:MAG: translation initiation factor IF-3 [Acidiferrobacterales bacterium]|nr:translation initiation factor IF-3 [Acidiferrobacterales bacterium]